MVHQEKSTFEEKLEAHRALLEKTNEAMRGQNANAEVRQVREAVLFLLTGAIEAEKKKRFLDAAQELRDLGGVEPVKLGEDSQRLIIMEFLEWLGDVAFDHPTDEQLCEAFFAERKTK